MRGTVIKRGAKWSVVIDDGRDAAGNRIRRWHSGFATKREAERARIELLGRQDAGTYVAPHRITFGDYLVSEWLPAKEATVKATTWETYERHILKYVQPVMGGLALAEVSAQRLNALYADLLSSGRRQRRGGLSVKTVRNVHGTLHKALEDAVRWGRLPRNPADQADPPKGASPEMRVWSPEQVRRFLEAVEGERLYAAWRVSAMTGVRRGELLGLRWSNVDLDAGRINVRQIRTMVGNEVVTSTPKTKQAVRTLALDGGTVAALRAYKRAQQEERLALGAGYPRTEIVFTNADGTLVHPVRFMRWFEQRVARSGLSAIRLHDLRHSYATALLREGVPLKVVSQRLGHASPMITLTTYGHVLPGDDEMAAEAGARAILG
jgi:integrase